MAFTCLFWSLSSMRVNRFEGLGQITFKMLGWKSDSVPRRTQGPSDFGRALLIELRALKAIWETRSKCADHRLFHDRDPAYKTPWLNLEYFIIQEVRVTMQMMWDGALEWAGLKKRQRAFPGFGERTFNAMDIRWRISSFSSAGPGQGCPS